MPSHGIRLDAEFLTIMVGAMALSYFVTDQIVSNFLFSTLIASLFFLMGLHLDINKFRKNIHRRGELGLGLIMVYLFAPVLAFVLARYIGGYIGEALIAIGVSTAAIGSPVVWSNIGKGDDGAAFMISSVSLLAGILVIPVLLFTMNQSINVFDLFAKNILILGAPLGLGISAQRYNHTVFNDMKHHFSKLSLWLLILMMGVQAHLLFQTEGFGFLQSILPTIPIFIGFTAVSYAVGYYSAKELGFLEKTARSIGFVTGSKGIAVALFVAAQLGGKAVLAVSIYFFIRQAVCGGIAEYYKHSSDLEKALRSINSSM